ncbi:hypothetical protein D7Z54_09115 [Salibacterium salarium]|uniref:Uncharacterized protein n=1 Tax=Salibacterium salarium TaxID=284579 RepID=A0A3R9PM41_9BACI|nr:hypothetical protein [Salibacterium salarium]RSL33839.1 hypothetical protein D7Z54_09115 [Salibacterium salarium]
MERTVIKRNLLVFTLRESYKKLLEDMSDENKHGGSAINKDWITKFDNGDLTNADLAGLFAIHVRRGMD